MYFSNKPREIFSNASNLKNFPLFTPKGHPIICWVIWIILQLQRNSIENSRINTINTIDTIVRIYWSNQYEDNQYDWSDLLTLQTSLTQLNHCCFLFRFGQLIKVRIIVVLQSSLLFLARSPLLHFLLLFAIELYSGTQSRGETALPTRNGLLVYISRSDVSFWVYPTNRTLLLCYRIYQLQQGEYENNLRCHSRWW